MSLTAPQPARSRTGRSGRTVSSWALALAALIAAYLTLTATPAFAATAGQISVTSANISNGVLTLQVCNNSTETTATPVSLVTYEVVEPSSLIELASSPDKLFSQIFFDSSTVYLKGGDCKTVTAGVPTCAGQWDVIVGDQSAVIRSFVGLSDPYGAFDNATPPRIIAAGAIFDDSMLVPAITETMLRMCQNFGPFCTVTQGGYGAPPHGNNPSAQLNAVFSTVFPHGISIGGGSPSLYSLTFTSAAAIRNFLPARGTPMALTSSATDPLTSGAGVFAGQVLTLELNVALRPDFGGLTLVNTGTSLDGHTVASVLAAANLALGGGSLPAGFTISSLNDLVDALNGSFDGCNATGFANAHLFAGP